MTTRLKHVAWILVIGFLLAPVLMYKEKLSISDMGLLSFFGSALYQAVWVVTIITLIV